MTREAFIRKWLGNKDYQYTDQNRDLMREDLDLVIEAALHQQAVSGSLPGFQDVIEARIKHFNSNYHTYEGSELQNALNIIRRLVPPIQWKIGGQ